MFSPVYNIGGGHSNTVTSPSLHPFARVPPCYWFLARIILNMFPANLFDLNQLDSENGPELRLFIASKKSSNFTWYLWYIDGRRPGRLLANTTWRSKPWMSL